MFALKLVDTHVHLQWSSFKDDQLEVIKRASEAGVFKMLNVGFDLSGSVGALQTADMHEGLYAAVGVHPHNTKTLGVQVFKHLEELCCHPKVAAIGEIGLDYHRNLSPRSLQIEAFRLQLGLARDRGLPVIIHSREAQLETHEMLRKYGAGLTGVMHCWSGSVEMATKFVELGFYISLAGPVTYRNAHRLVEVARDLPMRWLVIETDSPWLAPEPHRGKRNEPSFLPEIAERIAYIRQMSLEDLARNTSDNATRLFKLR